MLQLTGECVAWRWLTTTLGALLLLLHLALMPVGAAPLGFWDTWLTISAQTEFAPKGRVSAVWANSRHLDLFATANDGVVWSSWYEAEKGWQPWFAIRADNVRAWCTR